MLEAAPGGGPGRCVVTGCSGQVCADQDVLTTCEWREEYACSTASASATRPASADTPELDACLASASGI
ncbi:hypothetical protein BE20_00240 [Sorangium cellulosum]|nr:hypothetical protein BE20_00240 [Sorangium cellulosum]